MNPLLLFKNNCLGKQSVQSAMNNVVQHLGKVPKSDAENLQPQQDKLTTLSKPIGEGGEQLKPKEGHMYRAVDNAADATGNDKSFSNKTNWASAL